MAGTVIYRGWATVVSTYTDLCELSIVIRRALLPNAFTIESQSKDLSWDKTI